MITEDDYYMGRLVPYAHEVTTNLHDTALVTIARTNLLLTKYKIETRNYDQVKVTSGWRPASYNATVKGAAVKSHHTTGRAIDLADGDGKLDAWLMTKVGEQALKDCELWHEHPRDTVGWTHLQTLPPKSNNLHFYAR